VSWSAQKRVIGARDSETKRIEVTILCDGEAVHVLTGPTAELAAAAFVDLMNASGKTAPPRTPRTRADGWRQPPAHLLR